jgi:diguanylate cyclase (GGDEF)-like protein/PAS domain S-box-containing protein
MPITSEAKDFGVDRATLETVVIAEQFRLLAHKRIDLPINLLNAGFVCSMFWLLYPVPVIAAWLGAFCLITVLRLLTRRHYRAKGPGTTPAQSWGLIFTLNAFVSASLWGMTGSVILLTSDPVKHLFIVFVLGGMMAGGVVSNAAYRPAMVAFLVPIILPIVAILLTRGDLAQVEMGVMLVVFTLLLAVTGRDINRAIVENLRLRIGQDFLLAQLRTSEAAMAESQAIAQIGSWSFDTRTNTGTWSAEAYRIFGTDPSTFVPSYDAMLERVHPDDRAALRRAFAGWRGSRVDNATEHRLLMKDGSIKWLHTIGRTLFDAHGQATTLHGTLQDITVRRLGDEKLQFANSLLTAQMEAAPDGILVANADGRVIAFNQRLLGMWNMPRAAMGTGDATALLARATAAARDPAAFAARVAYLFAHPLETTRDEFETRDGRAFERYTVALTGPEAMNLGRVWSFRDVTERKQGDTSRALLAAIVESSSDAIVAETVEGTITSWNRSAERLFGYSAEEILGSNVRLLVPQERQAEVEDNLGQLARRAYIAPFDTERRRQDGALVPVSIAISEIRNSVGTVVGGSFISRDITERRQAAAALAYRDRLLHAVTVGTGILVQAPLLARGMPEALRIVGEALRADRVMLVREATQQGSAPELQYAWQNSDLPSHAAMPTLADLAVFPSREEDRAALSGWRAGMRDGTPLVAQLATSDGPLRALLEHYHNQSTLLVPIFAGGSMWGSLGIDACIVARVWTASEIETMKTFGEIAGSLIAHNETRTMLETSEARFRLLAASARDAIFSSDRSGLIRDWNAAAEHILGYTAAEAVGRRIYDLLTPASHRPEADIVEAAARDPVGRTLDITVVRKDGTEIAAELSISGTPVGDHMESMGILRDITDRKQADAASALLASIVDSSADAIVGMTSAGIITSWNNGAQALYGYRDDEMIGQNVAALMPPGWPENMTLNLQNLARGKGLAPFDTERLRKNGTPVQVSITASSIRNREGKAVGASFIARDITLRKTAENKLLLANMLLKTQMEASPDAILVVDADQRITSYNQRFADMWPPLQSLLAAQDNAAVLVQVGPTFREPEKFFARVRYLDEHPEEAGQDELEMIDGRFFDRHTVPLVMPGGKLFGRIWFFRDITASKQAAALALRSARFDGLTGLTNRGVFVEALQHALARAQDGQNGFALIYLDLDHFKDVNDTLGHPVGDALLEAVAARLRTNTRDADTLARFGGDEFAVIVGEVSEVEDVVVVATKLIAALREPFSIMGNDIFTGASIGIDMYGPDSADAESLLAHADVALYCAKADGRGTYRFFNGAMDAEVRTRVTLGEELRRAVDGDQLFLLYQPQVLTITGQIVGVEALIRWRHPTRGIVAPDTFIPVAERTGMIGNLGHWVLWEACRQARAWRDVGVPPVRVAVNVSALQFRAPLAVEADIAAALAANGLMAGALELELTESALISASREHDDLLQRLRRTGVTIAIDDFGTGYSSLDYLRRFPADRIKIAQGFVRQIETMPGDVVIVKATIGLAHELGIAVIAEGVETRAEFELLKKWGCGEIQGYYFAKPLAPDAVARLLRAGGVIDPLATAVT